MGKVNAALVGFTLMLTLVVAYRLEFMLNATAGVALFIVAIILSELAQRVDRIPKLWSVVTFVCAAGLLMMAITQFQFLKASAPIADGEVRRYEGYLCDSPQYDGVHYYELKIDTVNGEEIDEYSVNLVSYDLLDADLYDRFDGEFKIAKAKTGTYGVAYLNKGQGDVISFTASDKRDIKYLLCGLRQNVNDAMNGFFSGEVLGFVRAVALGDTSDLSCSAQTDARVSGLSHIIVVSGLHLSIISRCAFYLFMLMTGARRRLSNILCIFTVLIFMGIVGFTPSIMRAGVCVLLYMLASIIGEETNAYNSLGMAIIITAIISPLTVISAGFMLSAFSVLGINLFGKRMSSFITEKFRVKKPFDKFVAVICVTIGAQLGVLPVLLTMFERFSLVSVFSNFAITFAIDIMMICTLFTVAAFSVGIAPVATAFGGATTVLARYCIRVIEFFGGTNYLTVGISGYIVAFFGIACCITVLLAIATGRIRTGAIVCTALVLLCTGINFAVRLNSTTIRITQGGCYVCDKQGNISAVCYDNYINTSAEIKSFISDCGKDELTLLASSKASTMTDLFNDTKPDICITEQAELVSTMCGDDTNCIEVPSTVTLSGIEYVCRDGYNEIRINDFVIRIYNSLDADLSKADITLLPVDKKGDYSNRCMIIKDDSLAGPDKKVYNIYKLTLTVFDNGWYIVREG